MYLNTSPRRGVAGRVGRFDPIGWKLHPLGYKPPRFGGNPPDRVYSVGGGGVETVIARLAVWQADALLAELAKPEAPR
jgi:hypothetical protein